MEPEASGKFAPSETSPNFLFGGDLRIFIRCPETAATSFESKIPIFVVYTTWKGSMAQLPCIGLSWPLTFRHRTWEWLAIYFHYGVVLTPELVWSSSNKEILSWTHCLPCPSVLQNLKQLKEVRHQSPDSTGDGQKHTQVRNSKWAAGELWLCFSSKRYIRVFLRVGTSSWRKHAFLG